MTNILIVEDMTILRDTLTTALNNHKDFNVVRAIDDALLADTMCEKYKPDLVLMDICAANNSSGIEATFEIKKKFPNIKVILMTGIPDINFVEDAKTAGADGFIYKNISNSDLIVTISQIMQGYSIFPNNPDSTIKNFSLSELSTREQIVLRLFCEAKPRDEIAKIAGITDGYLRTLISNILNKTGFDSISRLAIYAVSHGYIHPKYKKIHFKMKCIFLYFYFNSKIIICNYF